MNKLLSETREYVDRLNGLLSEMPARVGSAFEVVLAPPASHLTTMLEGTVHTSIKVSAQNCGTAKYGAFTGEISPAVLREIGCDWVIIGHSERRHVFKEDGAMLLNRLKAALEENLNVIFCVGELSAERKAGKTETVLQQQLDFLAGLPAKAWEGIVIAYEPVWAIGTGENATPEQAEDAHRFVRGWIEKNFAGRGASVRILYGGSVKPDNSSQIMAQPDVDGLLVGGASLDAATFAGVIRNGIAGARV